MAGLQRQDKDEIIPTNFAIKMAVECGLIVDPHTHNHEYIDQIEKLKMFQQMSIACTFKAALITYHGDKLTEAQMVVLQCIFDSTPDWLRGFMVAETICRIRNSNTSNKDFAITIAQIMEFLGINKESETAKKIEKNANEIGNFLIKPHSG